MSRGKYSLSLRAKNRERDAALYESEKANLENTSTFPEQSPHALDGGAFVDQTDGIYKLAALQDADAFRAKRKGDWIQTYSGVQFWPLDARPEDVRIEDIAHALSNLCRFGGHTNGFYSVAQHSCLVAKNCQPEHRLAGLLHDATEAYLVDVPSPIKRFLGGYKDIESGLAKVIGDHFGVCLEPLPPDVHEQDARALWTEKRDLMKGAQPARWNVPEREAYPETISAWTPSQSERAFLRVFAGLRTH